jgi:hypothetical protein
MRRTQQTIERKQKPKRARRGAPPAFKGWARSVGKANQRRRERTTPRAPERRNKRTREQTSGRTNRARESPARPDGSARRVDSRARSIRASLAIGWSVPAQMWQVEAMRSRRRCGKSRPCGPGADVGSLHAPTAVHLANHGMDQPEPKARHRTVPAQMWQRRAESRRRCGSGEPSPGADVASRRSWCRSSATSARGASRFCRRCGARSPISDGDGPRVLCWWAGGRGITVLPGYSQGTQGVLSEYSSVAGGRERCERRAGIMRGTGRSPSG